MSIWELTLLLGADLVLNYGARRQSDRILDTRHHDKGKWQVSLWDGVRQHPGFVLLRVRDDTPGGADPTGRHSRAKPMIDDLLAAPRSC